MLLEVFCARPTDKPVMSGTLNTLRFRAAVRSSMCGAHPLTRTPSLAAVRPPLVELSVDEATGLEARLSDLDLSALAGQL
jgi:hypothetical protein